MDPVTLWMESLQAAYRLAHAERLNELNDVYVRWADARGIHPFSAAWGAGEAMQDLEPDLAPEGIATTPSALRRVAREDAYQAFLAELGQMTLEEAA
jgi:hypothetical protein